jgi:hypothetical protein
MCSSRHVISWGVPRQNNHAQKSEALVWTTCSSQFTPQLLRVWTWSIKLFLIYTLIQNWQNTKENFYKTLNKTMWFLSYYKYERKRKRKTTNIHSKELNLEKKWPTSNVTTKCHIKCAPPVICVTQHLCTTSIAQCTVIVIY